MASLITDKCTNCTVCASVCPTSSIFAGGQHYVVDSDTCEDCHFCVAVCPVDAIKKDEKKPTPEDEAAKLAAAQTAKQDKDKVKPHSW